MGVKYYLGKLARLSKVFRCSHLNYSTLVYPGRLRRGGNPFKSCDYGCYA